MQRLIRKTLLGAASVLALSIAGTALDYAANADSASNDLKMPQEVQTSIKSPTADSLRKDDIRWAQVELRNRGLYRGSLDGILGPETKRALDRFQKHQGLSPTASLDARTWEALTGETAAGQGSSMPPNSDGGGTINSPAASALGK